MLIINFVKTMVSNRRKAKVQRELELMQKSLMNAIKQEVSSL